MPFSFAGARASSADHLDAPRAWVRLAIAVLISAVGGVGMWSVAVVLPAVQADFGITRGSASLPYTAAMVGFALGGVAMGRAADRLGLVPPLILGALTTASGYALASRAPSLETFAAAHVLIGLGTSAGFAPLMADLSHWFEKRRGLAIAMAACGNYLAGAIWPPAVQAMIAAFGWRQEHLAVSGILLVALLPLIFALSLTGRTRPAATVPVAAARRTSDGTLTPRTLQIALCIAGFSCCAAMSVPQVHIVAYCGDLGYGVARGAEMLSLMLFCGIFSRIASGFIADRIGGLRTLLLGSALQGTALFLYLWFDGLRSLFVISALFGLFQGGLVPSYAIIVREYMPPREAGTRVGLIIMMTLFGMAFGGWSAGMIFDATGSYRTAFAHGLGWNLVNGAVVLWLILQSRQKRADGGEKRVAAAA